MRLESTSTVIKKQHWWSTKKKKKKIQQNKSMISEKMVQVWMTKELIGDKSIYWNKPKAWTSAPRVGMDKIRARKNMAKYLIDFTSSSTIHGFNHITAPHRHPIERFLAVLFIAAALMCLVLLSLTFWERYQEQATILLLDHDYKSFNVSKPALLVCPIKRIDDSKFEEVFRRHGVKDTKEARFFFEFLANMTSKEMINIPIYNETAPEKWLTILWELKSIVEYENTDDNSLGNWIVTEMGFCLIFNGHNFIYSSYKYWQQNNWTIVPEPAEIPSYNYNQREWQRSLKVTSHDVMVSPLHAGELPGYVNDGVFMARRQISTLEIRIMEVSTSNAVKNLKPSQRNCKSWNEGGLKFCPIYTYNMCINECKYKMIKNRCGCYPHYVRPNVDGTPICNATQIRCIGEDRFAFRNLPGSKRKICGCPGNCDTAKYQQIAYISSTLKEGSPSINLINVHSTFPITKLRQEIYFDFNDFLASVGGAAGLFLGASVISFVEIFYYATLRLYWYRSTIRQNKKLKEHSKLTLKNKSRLTNVVSVGNFNQQFKEAKETKLK